MSLALRHAGPAGPTKRWPFPRRVMPLLLWLGLGWLWAAVPVVAQDQAPPPAVEATGSYRNLAENHAGTFHLKREGGVVYATFQVDRSPVPFLARDQPEVLLTVPVGFRPTVDITWEVSARPVRTDGTPRPDHPDRRVFRMRVDTAGQVRYVDDPGVDGVGYLGYRTALAWPLAGTEPRVCDRHWNIRNGILAAVRVLDDIPVPCSQVDWTHLARIRNLSLHAPSWGMDFARHDLLGLTNLAALQVSATRATYSAELLAHTPRLQTLRMTETTLEELPADLFQYTPRLAHLSLGNDSRQDADPPVNLLVHTPHLDILHLEGRYPGEVLAQLLVHTPLLARLTVVPSTPLPETFLATVPRLTHLTIRDGLEPCATPSLLAPVPHLRHFTVRLSPADGELACLDRALRLHTPSLAELHLKLRGLQGLETGVLPHLPWLTRLTLDMGDRQLPAQLLSEAPELTHLALHGGTLRLPDGFLAHTPRLTSLSLQADYLSHMPPDLLAPVPELQQVRVDTEDATSLPTRFLDRVTELRMDTELSVLPWDFLMHAPNLEVLHLKALSLESLPENFLIHAPHLETFHLDAGDFDASSRLTSFPEGFLTHAPSLVELRLHVPVLRTFPSSFLGHVPRLEMLELEASTDYSSFPYPPAKMHVTSLPANFLIHAPRLRYLDLEPLRYVTSFPPGFLSGSPQLRYLNLDASRVSTLPADFLSRHPHLETVRLRANNIPVLPQGFLSQSPNLMDLKIDLQQVDALPEGFLAETSRLWNLEIDVHRVESLPPGFLADVPHLTYLYLRALNLTAWPADFLADAPRIRTLGLAMPLLEPTLTPDHRLWDTLQATSDRVKVIRPDPFYIEEPDMKWECSGTTIKLGTILELWGSAPDDRGRTLLTVIPWRERELFVTYWGSYCSYLIDSRFTAPTLEVCAADWDADACIPIRERFNEPDPEPGFEQGRG